MPDLTLTPEGVYWRGRFHRIAGASEGDDTEPGDTAGNDTEGTAEGGGAGDGEGQASDPATDTDATTVAAEATAQATDGQPQAGTSQGDEEPFDKDRAMATIAKLRHVEKTLSGQVKQLLGKVKEFEDAKLSEQEKLTRDLAETREQLTQREARIRELALQGEVIKLAGRLNIVDPEAAIHLLPSVGGVEYGDDGSPTNLEILLKELIAHRSWLMRQPTPTPPPARQSGGTTNPPAPSRQGLTLEDIDRMSPDEINARWDEVSRVLAGRR